MIRMTRRAALAGALVAAPAIRGARAAGGPLRIGAPLPATGGLAPEGDKQRRGYDLWAEAVNAQGGIKVGSDRVKVEIVYADYQSNTPRAVQLAERLISQDHCGLLFAPQGSGATKAASSVSERYKVPMIAPTASSKEVYDQSYKYLFGTFTPNETLTEPLADIVRGAAPNVRKIAILARNDLFPLAIATEMEKAAKARGIAVTSFEKYVIGTLDHASALTAMAAAEPGWVFITGYLNDLILARRQMADLKFNPPVTTMIAGPAYREFVEALGPSAEGLTSASWWHPALRYVNCKGLWDSTEAFNAAYRKKYDREPDYGEASSAACGVVAQLAIEAAGSTEPETMREALAAMDATTFFGRIKFGPNGQVSTLEPPVFQIQGGKPLVLRPGSVKQADFKLIGA